MAKSVEDKVADLRALLKKVQREVFEVGPLPEGMQALERLLCLVIQGDIALATSEKAVRALKARYSNWNEVRVAREFEVRDVFAAKRIPNASERAELVQEYLRRIFGLQNHLELDWAYDATSERREKLLNSIQMAPPQAGAVLDLDAVEDGGVPIHADLKRLFSRLGLVKVNPRDAQVMELLEPLVQGEELYPNYVALRLVAALGCDPKHPKSRKAQLLKEIWDARNDRVTVALTEKMDELGLPPKSVVKKAAPAKKATSAKKAAAKKSAKKTAKSAKKAAKKTAKKSTRKKTKVARK